MNIRNMRTYLIIITVYVISVVITWEAAAQERVPREFVPESGVISLAKNTPFNIALKALSEYSMRLENRPIIDVAQRINPINIDIANLSWKTALELITKTNHLSFLETETYIQITDAPAEFIGTPAGGTEIETKKEQFPLKPVNGNIREILISAKFFEADTRKLIESGVDWNAVFSSGKTTAQGQQNFIGNVESSTAGIFQIDYSDTDIDFNMIMKAMESNDIGKVIANPQITAIDGREGRVQIGQDFSIKQRDFAGNVLDVFVNAGIILTVTPVLVEEDSLKFIYLKVQAERSSATPGAISTVINKTYAETEMLLNDGEEALIGGLKTTEEYTTKKGLPVLNKIPKWFFGLGYLFGYESVNQTEKDLYILLKAEIIPTLSERIEAMKQEGKQ